MKLGTAIERYIGWKQAHGIRFVRGKWLFGSFLRCVGDSPLRSVRPKDVSKYLRSATLAPDTWWRTYQSLRAFFQFWIARRKLSRIPMPPPRAASPPPFRPFIFNVDQLRAVVMEASRKRFNRRVDAKTLETMIRFLYGAGALIHEALDLRTSDVDFGSGVLTLRRMGGIRKRTLPISGSMVVTLKEYDKAVEARRKGAPFFFVNTIGLPISRQTLIHNFRTLCSHLGITQDHGISRTPGLHDLRHTFAVHCLERWLTDGRDPRKMLPVLSGYLGHVMPISTEQYLKLVPARFSKHLRQLATSSGECVNNFRQDARL